MAGEKVVSRLTDIEYRVLDILRVNSRASVTEIAERLGVSRATVSRAIDSLVRKGVRFTVEVPEDSPRAFVIVRTPHADIGESYKLIDGRYMLILRGRSLDELAELIDRIEDREAVFLAVKPMSPRVLTTKLVCDYCGGPILNPIIYRRGRRTYYLCCEACLNGLKERLRKVRSAQ
ncbi:TRASH domain-containing protein [Vulcanisaeta thermophila]|uniref:TRASH domain-containing protein n=1 Tax=Vulcanisaeta thermophila TaxID=867917 RepID=UPI0008534915|nr:TRASH domain-containing protein [Vulcanisaeta thermophila]